jgi:CheY-like chemotaxis protein
VSCGLERKDISVDVAADVRAAIDCLTLASDSDTAAGLPRLVLLDFDSEFDDILTVLIAIRSSPRLQTVPIVGLISESTADRQAHSDTAYRHGINGVITKPDDPGTFADTIEQMATLWFDRVSLPPETLYSTNTTV